MKFQVIDHCPVPDELAELVEVLKHDRPHAAIQSCYRGEDAKELLHKNKKHTQAEVFDLHAKGVPGFGPANPPDRGSHLIRPYSSPSEFHHLCATKWPAMGAVLGMRRGDKRRSVGMLTRRLVFIGEFDGAETNVFDKSVEKAVKSYQGKKNLATDGVVGPATWAELDQSVRRRKESKEKVA
jgi:hypothetical protein